MKTAKLRAQAAQTQTAHIEFSLDAIAWIGQNFFIPETVDRRLILADYQKRALREALSQDERGLYNYSVIVWSDIKKSIKSTIAAAVALWKAWHTEWGQILVVANDLKQADTRVGYYIRRAIELNPELKAACTIRNYKITLPNHATIEAIPIDPTGEAGSNADMVVFSELWGAHQEAQKRMWTEATLPPAKFGKSFRWIETYAGFEGESELLEGLYTAAVKNGTPLDAEIEMYRSQSGNIFALWNTTPRLDWQSEAYYASEAEILLPSEFKRVHRNQWATSENAFITDAEWDACKDESLRLIHGEPLFVSLDAGVSDDNFALSVSSARRARVLREGRPAIGFLVAAHISKAWEPPQGGKIDFQEVKDYLRALVRRFNVVEISYDPYQLHSLATELEKEFGEILYEFTQGSDRLIADRNLYDLIREKRLKHNGDLMLRTHILNANAKVTGDYDKMRLVKRSPKLKIDLAVTLSMSAWRALENATLPMGAESSGTRVNIEQQNQTLPQVIGAPNAPQVSSRPNVRQQQSQYVVVSRGETMKRKL